MTRHTLKDDAAAVEWFLQQERRSPDASPPAPPIDSEADEAFAREVEAVRDACDALDRHGGQADILAIRQAALAARPERGLRPGRRALIAAGIGVLTAGLIWGGQALVARDPGLADGLAPEAGVRYATAVGERSTVTLPDGSLVALNTATVVQVTYDGDERAIRLLDGQAQFEVAKGSPLPFRVYARNQIITARGTVFDVRVSDDDVRVALMEGQVEVNSKPPRGQHPPPTETLAPGDVFTAAQGERPSVRPGKVDQLAQWRAGLVVFDDTPLSEAVDEINRYTLRPIRLADSASGRLRISGAFRIAEPERFAITMTEVFPLRLNKSENEYTLYSLNSM